MSLELILLILVVLLAFIFDYINGFHDTANAIATSVATRVLSPAQAIAMAALLNFAGAMFGTEVAKAVGKGIVAPELTTQLLVLSALVSAIIWNLITWYYGIPSSSSHALVFSIVGAGVAAAGMGAIKWDGKVLQTLEGLLLSPLFGFVFTMLLGVGLLWLVARWKPLRVSRIFGRLQIVSAAFMAFSHGGNDAQKTMGIITLALASYYGWTGNDIQVPLWVKVGSALAMGIGTATGGWRIIKTMGLKIVALRPIDGFAAEVGAATVIQVATVLGVPISTTHTISSSILGIGATKRLSAVKWGIAGRMVSAWVITIPACMAISWTIYTLLHTVTGIK
jgi:inorganic phosphate transporter, PiT family